MSSTWTQKTPMGTIAVETTERGVRTIDFAPGRARGPGDGAGHRERAIALALDDYFDGDLDALSDLEVDLEGVPAFRRTVLEVLRRIGPGEVTSYGKLAAEAGRVGAARAVGQAVGGNPVPLVVPCHRVIAADGTLGGFGCGLDMKRWLLAHEGHAAFRGGWEKRGRY